MEQLKLPVVGLIVPYSMKMDITKTLDSIAEQDYPNMTILVVNTTNNNLDLDIEIKREVAGTVEGEVTNVIQGKYKNIPINIIGMQEQLTDDAVNVVISNAISRIHILSVINPLYKLNGKDVVSKHVEKYLHFPQQIGATYSDYKDNRKVHYNKRAEGIFFSRAALEKVKDITSIKDKISKISEQFITHHIAECHIKIAIDS